MNKPCYVKTENAIYELTENFKIDENNVLFEDVSVTEGSMSGTEEWRRRGRVIQKSDNLCNLCDGFYATEVKALHSKYYVFGSNEFDLVKSFLEDFPDGVIKGFIETEDSLKFEVEMDKNGDVKLRCKNI